MQNEIEEEVQSTLHTNPVEDHMQIDAPEESFHLSEYDEPTEDIIRLTDFIDPEIQSPHHALVDHDEHMQQAGDGKNSKNENAST